MLSAWFVNKDGKAFMAMVHHFRPDLIDFNAVSDSSLNNLTIAFAAAKAVCFFFAESFFLRILFNPKPSRLASLLY